MLLFKNNIYIYIIVFLYTLTINKSFPFEQMLGIKVSKLVCKYGSNELLKTEVSFGQSDSDGNPITLKQLYQKY